MSKMHTYTSSDRRLIQTVIDKDFEQFELTLAKPDCTLAGVSRALYLSASMGLPHFCEMIFYDGIKQSYLDGMLICAISRKNRGMFDAALDDGADIHHDNEMPLRLAVSTLNRDFADLLISMNCDICRAFPPETLRSLFSRANAELNSQKILALISDIKQNNPGCASEGQSKPTFKLF